MDSYKHYIRIDSNNIVVHGFSDGFEQPQEGDVQLSGEFDRHFQIPLMTETGEYRYKLIDGQIIDRTQDAEYLLTQAKKSKWESFKASEITSLETFQSSTLGTPHTYLSGINDMVLLSAQYSFLKGDDYDGRPVIWYTVEAGNVQHTKEQFIQAYLDGRNHVASTKYHRAILEAQLQAATTVEQVDAIVW